MLAISLDREQLHSRAEAERAARERPERLAWERAEEQRRLEAEEAERAGFEEQLALETARLQEQARLEEEQARLEEERARLAQEERLRREREYAEEVARREEAERLARAQEAQEASERKDALDHFYQQHGFVGVNEPRRAGCAVWAAATTYPLHVAAELADARIVEMLLKEGASPSQKNSSGKTAAQVAQKKNKGGSHDGVLRLIGTEFRPRVGGA